MNRILFVCHGNICRSPMAEFVMKHLVLQVGLESDFFIESAATSFDAIGHDTHPGTKEELKKHGVPFERRQARKLVAKDYDKYDYLIGMDEENIYYMKKILGGDSENKIYKLLEFCDENREVADPWYTGNFSKTWNDVLRGCTALLEKLTNKN
ncbi:MAG: low molecular weight phosphotyrosine protein phosphatase [Treponema sp.]|nr:low molecular weight phosphotyrosine protein phosphatase [Treponema sp.]